MRQDLSEVSQNTRIKVLQVSKKANKGHIGSGLSICEIVVAILATASGVGSKDNDRTRIVLSKGHAALAYYSALNEFGIISENDLNSYCVNGTKFGTHPDAVQMGTDFMTGSLGQGLSYGMGLAMAKKFRKEKGDVYVIVGDGELQEGQNWEAIMYAAGKNIDNLIVTIDYNKQQIDGSVLDIMGFHELKNKFEAFNWLVLEMNGNDMQDILDTNAKAKTMRNQNKPIVILIGSSDSCVLNGLICLYTSFT